MGGKKEVTDHEILGDMHRQHALWLETRKNGRQRLGLVCFTFLVSAFHVYHPILITPFQHALFGFILAKTGFRSIRREMDVRSLWALNALAFFKATVKRCSPFHPGDRAFMSRMETTFKALNVDDGSTYGDHLAACLELLPGINPEARRLLACHIQLLGHAVPPPSLRSRLRLRKRPA